MKHFHQVAVHLIAPTPIFRRIRDRISYLTQHTSIMERMIFRLITEPTLKVSHPIRMQLSPCIHFTWQKNSEGKTNSRYRNQVPNTSHR